MKKESNKIKSSLLLLLIVTFAMMFILLYSCSEKDQTSSPKGYYTCSMHPQVIQSEPGTCPICAMNLTFVEAENNQDKKSDKEHDHSKMDAEKKAGHDEHKKNKTKDEKNKKAEGHFQFSVARKLLLNAEISTVPVKLGKFNKVEVYSGHVDYNEDPNYLIIITTKYDGWVEKLYVSKEGQSIKRGKLLMGIYSQKLLAAKEEHLTLYKSIKNLYLAKGKPLEELEKDPTLKATRQKLLYLDVSWGEIKNIEKNLETRRLTYFRSPISGILIKKNVLRGKFIKAGKELFQIANLNKLWIFIHIFEKDLPFIRKGDRVEIKTQAYGDRVLKGKIDLIFPFLRQKTRDIPVRIVVSNKNRILKPGMYVKVEVQSKLKGKVLTIPAISVVYSGNRNYVFVSKGRGKFEVRPVEIYARSQGRAIVSKGLKENELVVTNGQFLLDSEASLKEALAKGQMSGHNH